MLNFFLAGARSLEVLAHEEKAFVAYMRETGNLFTGDEYHFRLGIFLTNKRLVQEHNAAKKSFRIGLNNLAHYTPAEYQTLMGVRGNYNNNLKPVKLTNKAEESIDWRDRGFVNPVKNQDQCGSCWAFSMVTCCETAWAQSSNILLRFGEQNIVDCAKNMWGCAGGWPDGAWDYVVNDQEGKFNLESDYPYEAYSGKCRYKKDKAVALTKGANAVEKDEKELAKAVTQRVVSVCIDASVYTFQLYTGGIYIEDRCSKTQLTHAVAIVGYGTESSVNYWIVRNSWSARWGEEGYIRMAKDRDNQCGIATRALVPIAL